MYLVTYVYNTLSQWARRIIYRIPSIIKRFFNRRRNHIPTIIAIFVGIPAMITSILSIWAMLDFVHRIWFIVSATILVGCIILFIYGRIKEYSIWYPMGRTMAKEPSKQVAENNPWYTSDQQADSEKPYIKRIVARRLNFIVDNLENIGAINVLDAGCGDGVLLKSLAGSKIYKLYGVDYNPLRVSRAMQAVPQANVIQGDLRWLPISDEYFDAIILSQVLEHIPEDVVVLKSLHRILKPNGILILGVPNEGCFLARLRNNHFEPIISQTTDHVHFYTEWDITVKIYEARFTVERTMRENFFFPRSWMNTWFSSRDWGYSVMNLLGKILPSQTAGLYFVCRKK